MHPSQSTMSTPTTQPPPPPPTASLRAISLQDQDPATPSKPNIVSCLPAELRSQISLHLLSHSSHSQDLASLSLVSKEWRQTCLPLLWRDIQLLTKNQMGNFIGGGAMRGLSCFGCFTRSLMTRFGETVWPFLEVESKFEKVEAQLEEERDGEEEKEEKLEVDGEGNKRIHLERFDLLLVQDADTLLTAATNDTDPDPMGRNVLMTNESYYILLNKFLRSNICGSTLRTLHIYRVAHNPIRLLESIVLHLTGLRELHLFGGGGIVPYRRMPCLGPKAVRMFLENCPTGLEELVFGVKVKGDQPPELCSIYIPSEEEKSRSTRTHPHLRILSLPGSMNGFEEQVLAAGENGFLQGCTGLEVIESPNDAYLKNYWITDNVVIRNVLSGGEARPVAARGKVLKRFCASAEDTGLPPDPVQQLLQQQSAVVYQLQQQELEVQEIDPSVRDELLSGSILAIQATNQIAGTRKEAWHTIVVHNAGPLVAQAIALTSFEQQDALVALDLIDSYGVTSNHIQQILAHSKSLRCLEIRHSDTPGSVPPLLQELNSARTRLFATDVISSTASWGCLLLTTLHLEIGGIPRATTSNKEEGEEGNGFDKAASHRIQRQVYRQLAALTRLQELRLGQACERQDVEQHEALYRYQQSENTTTTIDDATGRVPGFQKDCLEMSLPSGLDILSSLTELAVLDVSRMDHRVRREEVKWMLKSWPNLRTVRGVKID
ncbi:MAG: hypothetical protein J3R72DRAFT_442850 [Linnemannia gamsii]|nr:MAG: hypothetical protein J3R72DRAFT_442850 [Linnemannia gamsii]